MDVLILFGCHLKSDFLQLVELQAGFRLLIFLELTTNIGDIWFGLDFI